LPPTGERTARPRWRFKQAEFPKRVVVVAIVVGVLFDIVTRNHVAASGFVVLALALAVGLGIAVRLRSRAAGAALGASVALMAWFAVRSSPWLLVPDAVAAMALGVYACDLRAGGRVRRSVRGLASVAISAFIAVGEAAPLLRRAVQRISTFRRGRGVPWARLAASLAVGGADPVDRHRVVGLRGRPVRQHVHRECRRGHGH
jgi:hypothetical protein